MNKERKTVTYQTTRCFERAGVKFRRVETRDSKSGSILRALEYFEGSEKFNQFYAEYMDKSGLMRLYSRTPEGTRCFKYIEKTASPITGYEKIGEKTFPYSETVE